MSESEVGYCADCGVWLDGDNWTACEWLECGDNNRVCWNCYDAWSYNHCIECGETIRPGSGDVCEECVQEIYG